jgi:hypothetical protein
MNAIFNYDFASLYGALLIPFTNEAFGPKLATLLLVLALAVFVIFLCFAVPQAVRLRAALVLIKGGSGKKTETEQQRRASFARDFAKIDAALSSNRTLSICWQEFRKSLMFRGNPPGSIILNSIHPQNFLNPRSLRVQYDFVRSLPNLFVGLGLLGTFVGLIAALTLSTKSLTTAVDQEQIKQALNGLLTTAAAKFYISAAGLVSSLFLAFFIRLTLKYLHGLVHQINRALEQRILFLNDQALSEKQLSVQQNSLEELKLFNTNIAMKIGDAVRTAVEASNDSLTNKLSDIANSFAKLVEASRDGAGSAVNEAMKGALDASLHQASNAIGDIADSLKDLPARLGAAAASIQNAGDAAAQQQERLAESVQGAVEKILRDAGTQVSGNIEQGTQNLIAGLKDTGSAFGDSASKIGSFFERFSASGDDYMKSLSSLSDQNAKLENNLTAISARIVAASDGVTKASSAVDANLDKVLTGISDFTRVATETNRAVRESQEAVRGTVETLQQQMAQHIQRFNNVDEKLATVFNSIVSHVELQSSQMAEQFSGMDQALASAVNQFEQLIDDLTEVIARRKAAE